MRNLFLTTVCVIALNTINAQQNDLASLDSNMIELESIKKNDVKTSLERPNSNYLKERITDQFSSIVMQWKYRIANYDLKSESIFDDSEKATYRIVFNNKQVNIIVTYSNSGEVLETKEMYRNIKIPYELGALLTKEYAGWSFAKNAYYVAYSKESGVDRQNYKVQIVNGNLKKTLNFDKNFKLI